LVFKRNIIVKIHKIFKTKLFIFNISQITILLLNRQFYFINLRIKIFFKFWNSSMSFFYFLAKNHIFNEKRAIKNLEKNLREFQHYICFSLHLNNL